MYILYKTTNSITGKYYIGVSNSNDKWYKGSGTALKNAMREYGGKNFIRETLETFETAEEAFAREAEVVNEDFVKDRNTYNIKVGGKGGLGHTKSEEHKEKIRQARKMQTNNKGGRKPAMDKNLLLKCVEQHGIRGAAKELNLTYYQCRDRYYRAIAK